jgi:Ca2+-transporting ATPase
MLRPTSTGQSTPPELRQSASFESRESRPTSPHNISSPQQISYPQNFLSVPVQRKRGASEGGDTVSTTDTTYASTDSQSKAFGANEVRHGAGDHPVLPDKEALTPDPGTEADFERDNNPFAFAPGHMTKLLNPKSLGAFHAMGGLGGLEKGLRTDRNSGLSVDEQNLDGRVSFEDATAAASSPAESDTTKVAAPRTQQHAGTGTGEKGSFIDRKRIFNDNRLPEQKAKNIFQLAWMAYNDKILILLTVAAVIALALGIYQAVGQPHPPGEPGVEWVEGVAIIVAIVVVVSVGAVNDWQKERQFVKLNKKKDARNVQVIRSGKAQEISVHDLLVGDLMVIEPGDILPVDGIFVTGHSVKCDESSATGESDIMKKTAADDVYKAMEKNENLRKMDPFMISGAKVTEGFGRMIVTATGIHSSYGKTMLALREDNEATPLQMKLNNLAEYIAKLGSAAAGLLFFVLLIKFLAGLPNNTQTPAERGQRFLDILIVAVTIVVVAVPEGLPLAVTLALAFATKRMLKDNNLVRVMRSCETMGNATCVCSDKTGTLTQNVMTVVAGTLGTSCRFSNRANVQVGAGDAEPSAELHDEVDEVSAPEFTKTLSDDTVALWRTAIAVNSTAFEAEENGEIVYVGSKTETALLGFAREFLAMDKVSIERGNSEITQLIPFDSERKCMGVVIKLHTGGYRLLVKGASEIMLRYCNNIVQDPTMGIEPTRLSGSNKEMLEHLIDTYASKSLRTIGFIHRDFEAWPPKGARRAEDDRTQAVFEDVCKDMTFLGLVGIQDPLRKGVSESVADCIMAGVFPRMVTGDNINTAKAIAKECGIFTPGGLAMEGPEFRKMSKHEQREIIPKLQVLARSSPEDKRVLVRRLKEMGETVAVTGDGTNDAPALKAADVGFSMNIAGTEVAKEASDIILMDDNFSSIVKALMWGRAVNDAVRKFLQFQITVNITAVLLAFITAVSSDSEKSVLTAVQLLWVNLIMDTMAALALATDPPTRKILDRKPDPKSAPLISVNMWKMIIGQAIYQLIVTLVLYFAGPSIFDYSTDEEMAALQTMVFNTFVWMQIFNSLNNRRLDNKFNILEGIQRNLFFVGIFLVMVGGQTLIIFVGGRAFQVIRQNGGQWGVAIVLGAISIPIGVLIRLIPDEFAAKLCPAFIKRYANRPKKDDLIVTDEENPWQFNQGLMDIKEELAWLRKYKGGRLRSLKFAVAHPKELILGSRSPSRSRLSSETPGTPHMDDAASQMSHSPAPPTPDSRRSRRNRSRSGSNVAFAGAAMAGIVAGSIGGWSPIERGRDDASQISRDRSKSDLSREVRRSAEVHPDTRETDPVIVNDPLQVGATQPPSQSTVTTPAFGLGPFGDRPDSESAHKKP